VCARRPDGAWLEAELPAANERKWTRIGGPGGLRRGWLHATAGLALKAGLTTEVAEGAEGEAPGRTEMNSVTLQSAWVLTDQSLSAIVDGDDPPDYGH